MYSAMSEVDLRILIASLEDRILRLESDLGSLNKRHKETEVLFKIACSEHAELVQRIDRMDEDISDLVDFRLAMCEELDPPCDYEYDNDESDK